MNDLLVGVQVELVVVEADHQLWVAAIHRPRDGRVNLHVKHLHTSVEHEKLFKLGEKLCFAVAAVLGPPLVDFTTADLLNRLLALGLRLHHLLLASLDSLAYNEADFGQDDGQLKLIVFQENQHVFNIFLEQFLGQR